MKPVSCPEDRTKIKKMTTLCLLLLVPGYNLAGDRDAKPGTAFQASPTVGPDLPSAEVSLVKMDPTEIHLNDRSDRAQATVTVQVFHTPLESEQAVTLAVGTYKTDPQTGVSVSYQPETQTVLLPAGASGKVNATVKVSKPQTNGNPQAIIVAFASIKPATAGIKIDNDDPGLPNHQATLTVRTK